MKGLLVLAVVLTACSVEGRNLTPSSSPSASPSPSPSATPSPIPTTDAEAEALRRQCESDLGELRDALMDLDSKLDVGMVIAEYRVEVQNIRVAYDRVPFKQLDLECAIAAAVRLENALNAYVRALNVWGDCITDFGCDTDSITPKLQREWRKASRWITQAERKMRRIAPL